MKKDQIKYICGNFNALCDIPVRLYKKNKHLKTFFAVELTTDPAQIHLPQFLSTQKSPEYIFVPPAEYYGVAKHGAYTIIAGPVGHFLEDISAMREKAFLLGLSSQSEIDEFVAALKLANSMPIERFMQMLCFLHFCLNGEAVSIKDLAIAEEMQREIGEKLIQKEIQQDLSENENLDITKHNFLPFEKMMLGFIEKGKVDELVEYFKETTPGTVGKIGLDSLRNLKNTFVAATTLVSRSAIKGGLDQEEAFSLSDIYIQRCETLNSPSEIINLQYHMVIDYTTKVKNLTENKKLSVLVNQAVNYIKKNFNSIQNSDEIAKAVSSSRSYLSNIFKKQTGQTMSEMILREKIEYSKRLLQYTQRQIIAISNYLGFSSQSHYQNTFKKFTGKTPKQFRDQDSK